MNVQVKPDVTMSERRLPFECIALVLQGGGALGAYQAGVYEALSAAGIHPDWIAGVSIGAINGAIIAGNPPNSRVDQLRAFWTQVTADGPWPGLGDPRLRVAQGDTVRNFLNQMSAISERRCRCSLSDAQLEALMRAAAKVPRNRRAALLQQVAAQWENADGSEVRRIDVDVATSREDHRSPRSDPAVQRPRWDRGPQSVRLGSHHRRNSQCGC